MPLTAQIAWSDQTVTCIIAEITRNRNSGLTKRLPNCTLRSLEPCPNLTQQLSSHLGDSCALIAYSTVLYLIAIFKAHYYYGYEIYK